MKSNFIFNNTLIFAGEGHGGIVAFKSLISCFDFIHVLTNDLEIKKLLRVNDKLISSFNESDAEIVVCAGYHKIIEEDILNQKVIINTHPSLLPKYRGLHSLAWAMLNFEEELGFTIHLMNDKIDDGDILEQFKVKYENQTSSEIMDLFDSYIENNLGNVVYKFINKEIIPVKQNRFHATWVCKRNLSDCIIDFNKSNRYLKALFKVLVFPYPLPIIKVKNILYEVLDHEFIDVDYEMHVGRVVNIEIESAYIKTAEGILVIKNIRDYNSKEIFKANEILKIGQRL